MRGLQLSNEDQANRLQKKLFKNGVLVDTCGTENNVLKIMPPINIPIEDLKYGFKKIHKSLEDCDVFVS